MERQISSKDFDMLLEMVIYCCFFVRLKFKQSIFTDEVKSGLGIRQCATFLPFFPILVELVKLVLFLGQIKVETVHFHWRSKIWTRRMTFATFSLFSPILCPPKWSHHCVNENNIIVLTTFKTTQEMVILD